MHRLRQAAHLGTFGLLGVALAAFTASAQEPEIRPMPVPSGPAETTLLLFVRTGPDLTETKLRETMELGLDKSKSGYRKPIGVRSVSPTVFDEISETIGRGGGTEAPPAAGDGLAVAQLPTRGATYGFRLPKPDSIMKSLTIDYAQKGPVTYTAAGKPDERLSLIVPGHYAVKLVPDDEPKGYSAEVESLGDKGTTLKGEWPKTDKFFSIVINDFKGDQPTLFRTLQDSTKIGNPLKNIEALKNFNVAFANLNSKAGVVGGPILVQNEHQPLISSVPDRNPSRVWMLFPLTKDEATKAKDRFGKESMLKLPGAIRKDVTVKVLDKVKPFDGASAPTWYELTNKEDGKGFNRSIPVADFKALQEKYGKDGVWRLVVWEFSDDPPQAIEVVNPRDQRRAYVIDEEVKGLAAEIAARAARDEAEPPKKDGPPKTEDGKK